jgi:hypothetical protein
MLPEFSARVVGLQVLDHLERRRPAIAGDEPRIRDEIKEALVPVRKAYTDYELPMSYLDALEKEIAATLPARWRAVAEPFTRLEQKGFGIWRGGDPLARLSYVLIGLVVGGLIVWAPFIPIWEKWFPFAVALLAWWLPDVQIRWHKRRYARELGAIATTMERAQPALDQYITITDLLPPAGGSTT